MSFTKNCISNQGRAPADDVARHTVHAVWHWNHFEDTAAMLTTIRQAKALLEKTITHTFPMTRVEDAWERQLTGNCGKVILHPWMD